MARHRKMLGSADLSGLNGFGSGMNPIWGVAIGGGTAGLTSIVVGHTSAKMAPNRDLIGLGTGLAVSGALAAMRSTRHLALPSVIGAFFAAGLSWLEKTLLGTVQLPAAVAQQAAQVAAGAGAGMGMASIRNLNGLGMPSIRSLNGLGIPSINQVAHPVGTIPGVAGNQLNGGGLSAPPVSLLGAPSAQAAQLLGMGGPQVHGLSAAYGATLLGTGR